MATGDGTVGKALDVLDRVAAFGRPVRFSELLPEGGYPKATLYRLLQVLVNQGLLAQDPDSGHYELGVRLVRLAHQAWAQASLAPVARPHIDALAAATGEAVHLAQLDGGQVLYVDKVNAHTDIRMFSATGRVGPAYCTGVGKAMLAFLPETDRETVLRQQSFHAFTPATLDEAGLRAELARIRADGVAWDREEHETGIVCVAAPILSRGGRVLGALSLTSTTRRRGLEGLEKLTDEVVRTAQTIGTEAQFWRFPERAEMRMAE